MADHNYKYEIFKLSNTFDYDKTEKPTITLLFGDPGWEEALSRWRTGANPTDSKEWKKGVIASTRLVHTVTVKVVCKPCEGCGDPFYVDGCLRCGNGIDGHFVNRRGLP